MEENKISIPILESIITDIKNNYPLPIMNEEFQKQFECKVLELIKDKYFDGEDASGWYINISKEPHHVCYSCREDEDQ